MDDIPNSNLTFPELSRIASTCYHAETHMDNELLDEAIAKYYLAAFMLNNEFSTGRVLKENISCISLLLRINNGLATCYEREGKYKKTIKYLNKAYASCEKLNNDKESKELMEINWRIGKCHYKKGRLRKGLEYFEKVESMFGHIQNHSIEKGTICHYIGLSYAKMGDYAKGLSLLKEAKKLRKKEKGKKHKDVAKTRMALALCYSHIKTSRKSLRCLKKAHKVFKKLSEKRELVKSHIYQGDYFLERDRLKKALKHYKKGFVKLKKKEDLQLKMLLHRGYGKYFLKKERYKKAEKELQTALKLGKEVLEEYNTKLATLHSDLADCYAHQKNYAKALRYCQMALIQLLPDYDKDSIYDNPKENEEHLKVYLLEILNNKAYAFYGLYQEYREEKDLEMAYQTFLAVDDLVHSIRKDYQMENSKLFLASRSHKIYDAAVGIAYQLHKKTGNDSYLEKCFEWAEMGQSYILLSDIRKKEAKIEANIPSTLLKNEESWRLELTRLDKFINWEKVNLKINKQKLKRNAKLRIEKEIKQNEEEYKVLHTKYQNLVNQFETEYPNYYQLKYDVKIACIKELKHYLMNEDSCKGAAMIEYFVGEKYLYVFVITKDTVEVVRDELPQEFEEIIKEFLATVSHDHYTEKYRYIRSAYRLFQILFPHGILKLLENWRTQCKEEGVNDRLIIIADEELAFLPFEALLTKAVKNSDVYEELPYFTKDYILSYHYSATLWLNRQQKQNGSDSEYKGEFVGFAPAYGELKDVDMKKKKGAFRSWKLNGKEYVTLEYSETEVANIAKMFDEPIFFDGESKPNSCICIEANATENNFKELAPHYKYVLVSGHGDYDDENPDKTCMVFSPNDKKGKFSHFNMADAYNLQVKAKLVVLSCCETGLGQVFKGEGVLGMNRGFLYAGAENVIYTLFKVYDKHSAELTQYFFRFVTEKKLSYAEALREAKLLLIKKGGYKPVHWAGFVLIGG